MRVIPIFRIFDVAKALEFYVDWLGFEVEWNHKFREDAPSYMKVVKGEIVLHLSEHHGDCCPGAKAFVEYTAGDLIAWHAELLAKEYRYNRPGIGPAEWGATCMEVVDPFGNKLLFSQPFELAQNGEE